METHIHVHDVILEMWPRNSLRSYMTSVNEGTVTETVIYADNGERP